MITVAGDVLVGPWALEERIGGGGQAAVHRARHSGSRAPAAVKVFHRSVWADRAFRVRFRRECDALTALRHPNIVPILDCGEHDGRGYLAMSLAAGGSLAERLASGPMRPAEALAILAGVAAALDAAHAAGVLHRDVTPGNILLDPQGPWLADFGIARRVDATLLTGEGELIGTAGYMAPEVIGGRRAAPASDRYGLAAVAFQALTGRRVFEADGLAGVLYAHAHRTPPRASRVLATLPRALDDAMARGLAKDPSDRPRSCAALVASLAAALGLDHAAPTRAMTRLQAPRPVRRRRRVLVPALATVAGLSVLGGGAAALTAVLSHDPPAPVAAAPPPVPVPLTVPSADGGELTGSPVGPGDLPGDATPAGAMAADVGGGVRVTAVRGGWAALASSRAGLIASGFSVEPLVVAGRTIGVLALPPLVVDLTGRAPRWALAVLRDASGSRALAIQGPLDAPARYAARLARARGDALVPLA